MFPTGRRTPLYKGQQRPCGELTSISVRVLRVPSAVTVLPLFLFSQAAAHSSPTPQWVLFRLFSTPASLLFTTTVLCLRARLLSDYSNIVLSGMPPPVQTLPEFLFFPFHVAPIRLTPAF